MTVVEVSDLLPQGLGNCPSLGQSRFGGSSVRSARYAAGRPVAWLDDDFDVHPAVRDAFLAKRAADGLATELVCVDPHIGITDEHLATIAAWATTLSPEDCPRA